MFKLREIWDRLKQLPPESRPAVFAFILVPLITGSILVLHLRGQGWLVPRSPEEAMLLAPIQTSISDNQSMPQGLVLIAPPDDSSFFVPLSPDERIFSSISPEVLAMNRHGRIVRNESGLSVATPLLGENEPFALVTLDSRPDHVVVGSRSIAIESFRTGSLRGASIAGVVFLAAMFGAGILYSHAPDQQPELLPRTSSGT